MQSKIFSGWFASKETPYKVRCGFRGCFQFPVQECYDIDSCYGTPCGANGNCCDCSASGCERFSSFLQRSFILGGKQYEAIEDCALNCSARYQILVVSAGELM